MTDHNEPDHFPDARKMVDLAARIERAEGPDRALDQEIFSAIGAPVPFQFANKLIALEYNDVEQAYFARVTDDMRVRYAPPHYTASIDAAMQLVPEGREWSVDAYNSNGVYPEHVRASAWVQGSERVFASTPAIALSAAAIRARSAS